MIDIETLKDLYNSEYQYKKLSKINNDGNESTGKIVGYVKTDKQSYFVIGLERGHSEISKHDIKSRGGKLPGLSYVDVNKFALISYPELLVAFKDYDDRKKYPNLLKAQALFDEIGGNLYKFKYSGVDFEGVVCGYSKSSVQPVLAIIKHTGATGWKNVDAHPQCEIVTHKDNKLGYLVASRKSLTLISKK